MRRLVRVALIGLVGLVALGLWLNRGIQPQTKTESKVVTGACQSNGTTLVIDYGKESSIPIEEKCIENFSGSSWNLLKEAGSVTGTQKYPVGFVCRINNFPTEQEDKCIDTPGLTSGSWAFFIASKTSWEYSPYGAATHKVKCGTSEGWRFLAKEESLNTPPQVKPTVVNCEK